MSEIDSYTDLASPASFTALEFDSLLRVVSGFAATDLGRDALLRTRPLSHEPTWRKRRREMEEMERLLEEGAIVPSWEEPLQPLFATAAQSTDELGGVGLLQLARLLRWAVGAFRRLSENQERFPELAGSVPAAPTLESLSARIVQTLDDRGHVRDDATPRLTELGRQVRGLRQNLYSDLEKSVRRSPEAFSEDTVTLHDGRLVLLLQSGARGRVQGLVHGRSGTGQSFYFEPLESVESNNRFREAVDEEDEERRRILRELFDSVRDAAPEVTAVAQWLGHLDTLQASCRYGKQVEGRLADLAEGFEVHLVAVRHPLLDSRLERTRQRTLGLAGHAGEVVPLDLDLSSRRRLLIITGPNAGGKTVALKTLGISALAHQSGLPIPAAAGTRLPLFEGIVAQVGDEQDLLADRSTFSGRLLRLGEAWEASGPGHLVLLDELGSGTDPEEGAALAIALAEELLAQGALTVVTTHLVRLAMQALEWNEANCGAMEFDSDSGSPTFRLVLGPPGGSEAIALARRLGLASRWLERAESLVDSGYRSLLDSIRAVEDERKRTAILNAKVEQQREMLAEEVQSAKEEAEALHQERRRLGHTLRAEIESFRKEVLKRLEREVESLRRQPGAPKSSASKRKAVEKVASRVLVGAPEIEAEPEFEGELKPGMRVRHRSLGWEGVLEAFDGARATVLAGSKRLRLETADLVPATASKMPTAGGVGRGRVDRPLSSGVTHELNLIGQRVDPALDKLAAYIDDALLAGHQRVRIVHGHGTGRLKSAVREWLKSNRGVAKSQPAPSEEGGDGATVVWLRE